MSARIGLLLCALPLYSDPASGVTDIPQWAAHYNTKAELRGFRDARNTGSLRAFAWRQMAGLATEASPGVPVFLTWFSRTDVLEGATHPGGFQLETSGKLAAYHTAIVAPEVRLEGSYFNQVLRDYYDTSFGWPANSPRVWYRPRCVNELNLVLAKFYEPTALGDFFANHVSQSLHTMNDAPGAESDPVSRTVKVKWELVRHGSPTIVPVWDPEDNPALPDGNPPNTWKRFVAVTLDPGGATGRVITAPYGERMVRAKLVPVSRFFNHPLTALDADRLHSLSNDPSGDFRSLAKATAGDVLILVAMHVATKDLKDWLWMTFWWHDRPRRGAFAAGRPREVVSPWNQYLMDVAFDMDEPHEKDGRPNVTFNPYFEAGLKDGVHSNCMTCHRNSAVLRINNNGQRLVTRGKMDGDNHPAFFGKLRADYLWSVTRNDSHPCH